MKTEQKSVMDINLKSMNEFMVKKGWQGQTCSACGRTFFSKPLTNLDTSVCGWHKCNKENFPFRTFSKRKRMLTPAQISAKIDDYFSTIGFSSVSPLNIANFEGQTDLVIAGVQMFDDIIHKNNEIRSQKFFVRQPCIRMQFQPQVESKEGTSTAFVNVCTEKMVVDFDEHLQIVDHWCAVLSNLGLHMNDVILAVRTSDKDWGTGKFSALEIFFSYGGLELGDAAYLLIPQSNRQAIPISDIGFGLERIAWVVNKTDSYFDLLRPWTADGTREMFDSYRSLTLLALCGVQATNKGPGLQFRRFAKVLSEKYYGTDVYSLVTHYFDYWAHFIEPSVSRGDAVQSIRMEIERFVNLRVCEILKLPPPRDETSEAYFERLVYTCNISIYDLREAIKICKIQK